MTDAAGNAAAEETASADANVASRLTRTARLAPSALAIVQPTGRPRPDGARNYEAITFEQLDQQTTLIAQGLIRWGVRPGMRLVLAVPFGAPFIRLTFALLKAGTVPVLVDPGMGRKNLVQCLEQARPDGFVAIPKAQAIRAALRRRFPSAQFNLTVGRRWFWGGRTLAQIERLGRDSARTSESSPSLPVRTAEDDAAVIFTTGSTGPPKGVRYTHGIFNHQIDLIRQRYGIRPGSRDLACFPLFGLFDAVMGVTTVIPDMDPTRPADVDPRRILKAVQQWEIDQAFGSPALWDTVSRWCVQEGQRLETLRLVLSAGAPVPPAVLDRMRQIIHPDAQIYTPYGATEALPLASIESREVLEETAELSRQGRGTCVGTRFPSIEWKVVEINDSAAESLDALKELPRGKIGELVVSGPVVTDAYVTQLDQNAMHKVRDGECIWHRMGDVGYLDEQDRFWFCGRKAHRVETAEGTLYTVPCETIFNQDPRICRSALVGIPDGDRQCPVLIVEPDAEHRPETPAAAEQLIESLCTLGAEHSLTQRIRDIRIYPDRLPVDIRHNSKIFREQLAKWAASDSTGL